MQPLFIGPMDIGLQKDLTPFMIPEKAFPVLEDSYVFRGRVKKKPGKQLLGRLRRAIAGASIGNMSSGVLTYNLLSLIGLLATEPNAQLIPGDVFPIVVTVGGNTLTDNTGTGVMVISGGPILTANINYSTSVLTITTGAFGPTVATVGLGYYPVLPVMGILQRQNPGVNTQQQITFDQKYAYEYTSPNFQELPSTLSTEWNGDDTDFFWGCSYGTNAQNASLFWVTNNVPGLHSYAITAFSASAAGPPSVTTVACVAQDFSIGDTVTLNNVSANLAAIYGGIITGVITGVIPGFSFTMSVTGVTGAFTNGATTGFATNNKGIHRNVAGQDGLRYYDGTSWFNANPVIDATNILQGGLIVLPFKNRLLVFSTWEGNTTNPTNYTNRVRWSFNSLSGAVTNFASGWRSDILGFGGFEDAPTDESIVSAGYLKDDIIVYFEASTWKLVYQGNEIRPFVWQKINTELGAESTFSFVNFDNGLVAFGNVGIHTTNGISVQRIDELIPDDIFNITASGGGPKRVHGIRDYFLELCYFTYLDFAAPGYTIPATYPNRVLVYNYRNNTWSNFRESFTCYGPFQRPSTLNWGDLPYNSWGDWNTAWNSGTLQKDFFSVAAGNQQGYVFLLLQESSLLITSRVITAIAGATITSPNHNFVVGDYINIDFCKGVTNLNGTVQEVLAVTQNTITIGTAGIGTYLGDGEIALFENINITTKMFNPFWGDARRFRLKFAEYLFTKTAIGQVTINVFIDTSSGESMNDSNNPDNNNCLIGTNIISTAPEPQLIGKQISQEYIWHRQYYSIEGETFQIKINFSPEQLVNPFISGSEVELHGIILHFEPAGTFQ